MTFVASPAQPPAAAVSDEIAGDDWRPALKLSTFKAAVRIGSTVTDTRAREALLGGINSADVAIEDWRTGQEAAGVATLVDAVIRGKPGRVLGAEKLAVILYRRAVHAFAAADLVETHNDVTATDAGRDRREAQAASADEHRATATRALRDLMTKGRSKVALI